MEWRLNPEDFREVRFYARLQPIEIITLWALDQADHGPAPQLSQLSSLHRSLGW